MSSFFKAVALVTAILIAFVCAFAIKGFVEAKFNMPDIEAFVDKFYDLCKARDFKTIYYDIASPKFRESGDFTKFELFMQHALDKLGDEVSKDKGPWRVNYGKEGLFFLIQYSIKRTKFPSHDTFVLIKTKDQPWRIFSYSVNSKDLSKRFNEK